MRCYASSSYNGLLTTIPFPPTPTKPTHYSPFNGHKPANYNPTRTGAGPLRVKAKGSSDGFAAVASSECGASFYELLGVPEWGTVVEVKQAYKQLARKYHPDVSPPGRVEEYTRRFIQVQQAYETLSDPARRALYDRDMANGIHFAFFASRRSAYNPRDFDQVMEQRNEWKTRWQSQLSELKRRSKCKDGGGNMSWAARMRKQRDELVNEL